MWLPEDARRGSDLFIFKRDRTERAQSVRFSKICQERAEGRNGFQFCVQQQGLSRPAAKPLAFTSKRESSTHTFLRKPGYTCCSERRKPRTSQLNRFSTEWNYTTLRSYEARAPRQLIRNLPGASCGELLNRADCTLVRRVLLPRHDTSPSTRVPANSVSACQS